MDLSPNTMMSIEPGADGRASFDAVAGAAERRCAYQKSICSVRSVRSEGGSRFKKQCVLKSAKIGKVAQPIATQGFAAAQQMEITIRTA